MRVCFVFTKDYPAFKVAPSVYIHGRRLMYVYVYVCEAGDITACVCCLVLVCVHCGPPELYKNATTHGQLYISSKV